MIALGGGTGKYPRDRWNKSFWRFSARFSSFYHACSERCNFASSDPLIKNWISGCIYMTSTFSWSDRFLCRRPLPPPKYMTRYMTSGFSKLTEACSKICSSKSALEVHIFYVLKTYFMTILTKFREGIFEKPPISMSTWQLHDKPFSDILVSCILSCIFRGGIRLEHENQWNL